MKNILFLFLLVACANTPSQKPRQNLVLIQGVHVDGTVWHDLKTILSKENLNIMDLGRVGRDSEEAASLRNIATLSCKEIPQKSTLVVHSYGGAIANQISGTCPDKIKRVIYVTAVVPLKGEKPFDLMNKTDQRNYSKVVTFGRFKIIPKDALTYFKETDPKMNLERQLPALHSEWISLISESINYDEEKFKALPKTYIYTKNDPVLSLTTQFQYTSRTNISDVKGIEAGHFPMLSNPEALAQEIILAMAKD